MKMYFKDAAKSRLQMMRNYLKVRIHQRTKFQIECGTQNLSLKITLSNPNLKRTQGKSNSFWASSEQLASLELIHVLALFLRSLNLHLPQEMAQIN